MPLMKLFYDELALALHERAMKSLSGSGRWVDDMPDVAESLFERLRSQSTVDIIRMISSIATMPRDQLGMRVSMTIEAVEKRHKLTLPVQNEIKAYLNILPIWFYQRLRRPFDSGDESLNVPTPSAQSLFELLPPHPPRMRRGQKISGLSSWELMEFIGFGELTETWLMRHVEHHEQMVSMKFVVDDEAHEAVGRQQDLFLETFRLVRESGVVPLRTVYLETRPRALESPYLHGTNLASLMNDWRIRNTSVKPGVVWRIVRRLAEITAKAHKKGIVHRGIKPSNILLLPSDNERFTLWLADFGWSQISSARSLVLARGGTPLKEQRRLASLGAHGASHMAAQQAHQDPPDARDDVYAIGLIWYQLLMKNPAAHPAADPRWQEQLPDIPQPRLDLLEACLSDRPDRRPESAVALVELMKSSHHHDAGLSSILKTGSGEYPKLILGDSPSNHSRTRSASAGRGASGHPNGSTQYVTNSIGMTFALIPPGEFMMGSEATELGHRPDEAPRHRVLLKKPFYLGVFLVTQSQYMHLMQKNPSLFSKENGCDLDHPVDSVTWYEAVRFCEKLNDLTDEEMQRRSYRLPSEAEWEYACRARTTTAYAYGESLSPKRAHYATAGSFGKSGGKARSTPVGSLTPNPFGLYDMHGNLLEWVNDWYSPFYYHNSPTENPTGPDTGEGKVVRGGCYKTFGTECRSAARRSISPGSVTPIVGFRVLLEIH